MIGGGLDEQLEKFVREHSDTKLVIVDTLQKVREAVSDSYSYSLSLIHISCTGYRKNLFGGIFPPFG